MEIKGQVWGPWDGSAGRLLTSWQKWSECIFAEAELAPEQGKALHAQSFLPASLQKSTTSCSWRSEPRTGREAPVSGTVSVRITW